MVAEEGKKHHVLKRAMNWRTIFLIVIFISLGGRVQATDEAPDVNMSIAITAVHTAAAGLGSVLKDVGGDESRRVALIRSFVNAVRFYPDKSGYFFVYGFSGRNVAHAIQKDLAGRNLSGYKDSRGKYVIREMSTAAKKGGGFVEFYWGKPGGRSEKKKIAYVETIPGTDYFIGSGVSE